MLYFEKMRIDCSGTGTNYTSATPTKEREFETRSLGLPTTTGTISVPESPTSTPPLPTPLSSVSSSFVGVNQSSMWTGLRKFLDYHQTSIISDNAVISSRRSLSEIESKMSASNTIEDEDEAPVNTLLLENIVGINDWDAIVDDSHDHT